MRLRSTITAGLAKAALPLARAALNASLLPAGLRYSLWTNIIKPYLIWRPYRTVTRTRTGVLINTDNTEFVDYHIYAFGTWEPQIAAYLQKSLAPGDVFIDVGANIGFYALTAAKLVGTAGEVVAIEASPTTATELAQNVELNGFRNITIVNAAVSDKTGTLPFFYVVGNKGASTTLKSQAEHWGATDQIDVPAAPLGDLIDDRIIRQARLIKIDVEGAELGILLGMREMAAKLSPECEIMLEIMREPVEDAGLTITQALSPLTDAGFEAYRVLNDYSARSYLTTPKDSEIRRFVDDGAPMYDLLLTRRDPTSA